MPLFSWKDSLSVQVKSMDEQHKKLIDLLNYFYDGIATLSNTENMSILIGDLKKYIDVHFSLEEKYMQQTGYPDYQSHKKEHDHFVAKVAEVEEKFKAGKLVLSLEMTTFLKDWLIKHIQVVDKKYSDFFQKNGIK